MKLDKTLLATLTGIVTGVAGFLSRSLWDHYLKQREQVETLARQKRIEFLERQLSQFYWPLYLHLQKNNVIWEHLVQGRAVNDTIQVQVDFQLYKSFFLPNHNTMMEIIESNAHLAQPDREFNELLLRFVRHITIYKTIRDAGLSCDPIAVGDPYPTEFFSAVESRLRSLQQRYDHEVGRIDLPVQHPHSGSVS